MDKSTIQNYLKAVADSDRFLVGQEANWNMATLERGYSENIEALHTLTGKYPAMIGANYGREATPDEISAGNQLLIDYWDNGGLITIFHWVYNPWTGGKANDITGRDLIDLMTPGTAANLVWMAELDKVATGLQQLRDAGVVVLWRPLHEMTYTNAFWWCYGAHAPDTEPYKNVWRQMHNYFTVDRALDNLLWVYCAADQDEWRSADIMYPGDEYVDIVGVDIYDDDIVANGDPYNRLLATGKPFSLPECGPGTIVDGTFDNLTILNSLIENYPRTAYFLVWQSWGENKVAIVDNQNAADLMNHPNVITREDIQMDENYSAKADELELKAAELEATALLLRETAATLRTINAQFDEYDAVAEQLAASTQSTAASARELADKR